jgi:iron(III) transport system ATP-binding protein
MGIRIKNLNKDYFSEGKRIRALVAEPKVILFDEPLSNLDAKLRETRKDLRDFLTELKITAVYVTHDRVEALALSDAIAVMKDGSIMEIESPKKICFDSDHQFVADFIGRANLIEGKVKVIEDSYAIIDSSIGAIACPKSSDTSPGNTVTCVFVLSSSRWWKKISGRTAIYSAEVWIP